MWVARQNTIFSEFSDYLMSLNKMELIGYVGYIEQKGTYYQDWKIRDDMFIFKKVEFERTFGIKLDSLEQIEI